MTLAPVVGAFPHRDYCELVGREITQLSDLVVGADLGVQVPACPRWKLRDLVHHTGAIHRWATSLVEDRSTKRRRIADTDDWPARAGATAASEWLLAGRDPLVTVLASADPDAPMWAWGADQHVRFWSRRMTHETGVHRADAELALGMEPAFPPAVAADGVSELLANLWRARAWRREVGKLRGSGQQLQLRSTDTTDRWTIVRGGDGFTWLHQDATVDGLEADQPGPTTVVSAPAHVLYLFVWKRVAPQDRRITVSGDLATLEHWIANSSV